MTSKRARYSEHNAATYNAAFDALQARYELGGNALENIVSGTLTASSAAIDLPFTAGAYKYLRLLTNLKDDGAGDSGLKANGDSSTVYDYIALEADGGSLSGFPLASVNYVPLYADSTNPLSVDSWIFLTSTGFNLIGYATLQLGGITFNSRIGGVYRGGPVTSLQLTFQYPALGGLYLANTSYLLQGLPI